MGCTCSSTSANSPNGSSNGKKGEDIRDLYKIGKLLGSGAFGQVRECTRREDGEVLAVKIMERRSREVGHWSNENMFRREVQLLGILDNRHIVSYIDFYEDKHFLYAVIERCDGGELFEQIVKSKRFSEEDASYICRQMLLALAYVHSINIVHRDIKAENFLFKGKDIDSELKLIDFGMSARLSSKHSYLTEVCGSPHYLSPELIRRQYGTKADMWALGVLIYLLIYGRYPFDGSGTDTIVKQIMKKPIDYKAGNIKPSAECVEFMQLLLERDPKKRASADEALLHKWVEDTYEDRQRREKARASIESQKNLIECVRSAHRKVTLSKKRDGFSKKAEARLNHLLEQVERQWEEGKACGVRVSPLNQGPNIKPEFARHDKRMNTTPSRYVGGSLADLQAFRRAIESDGNTTTTTSTTVNDGDSGSKDLTAKEGMEGGLEIKDDDDCVTGSTEATRTAEVMSSINEGHRSSSSDINSEVHSNEDHNVSSPPSRNVSGDPISERPIFDWDSAEKSFMLAMDENGARRVLSDDDVYTRNDRRTVTVSVNQKDTVEAAALATKDFSKDAYHSQPYSSSSRPKHHHHHYHYHHYHHQHARSSNMKKDCDYSDTSRTTLILLDVV